jgi:hypothetical protein
VLVGKPEWMYLKEYLLKLQELTTRELAMAQSELAVYRSQGKWALLEQLIHLPETIKSYKKEI